MPEFGGTIHGYCGETLDATLLDLLEWHRRPTMEDMHKAYVGRSRTRRADDMLLVQPYSPHLFRQGEMHGPTILMDVLRKKKQHRKPKISGKKLQNVNQTRKRLHKKLNG